MRYTAKNMDVREVPPDEVWVGIIDDPDTHIALATRSKDEDDLIVICRLSPDQARQMGEELIRTVLAASAPLN